MDLTPHLDALRADLESVAGADEALAPAVERLARALQPAFHLRLLDAIGDAALELTEQLPEGQVGVQLAGRDIVLTYTETAGAAGPEPDEGPSTADGEPTARLTLRMPEHLKLAVERAAAADGISTNAWLVGAVHASLGRRPHRHGHRHDRGRGRRLSGYGEA
jgi:predicted HicB family RNase H-like nuclease